MLNNRLNILIPDGESTFAFLVIPCLAEISNAKIHVLSSKSKNPIRHSKYIASFSVDQTKNYDSWLAHIQNVVKEKAIDVIVPIAEIEVRFCIQHKTQIDCAIIPLPELEAFDIAINKLKLNSFCVAHDVPVPHSVYVKDGIAKVPTVENLRYPIIIKPLDAEGGGGIVKFESYKDLQDHLLKHNVQTYFLQEYVKGYDIDCSVLCDNGEILTYTIQKGFLEADTPYQQQLGIAFLENEEVLNVVKTLMKALKWNGIAHVDLRYDEADNTYKVLEINARFWGSLHGSRHVGVNFPKLCVDKLNGKAVSFVPYAYEPFLQLKGIAKRIRQKPKRLFDFNFIINHTDLKDALKDPKPMWFKTWYWLQRKF